MGAVTGVAIGIGLGCPQRHVFAFDTDGSIMYDLTIFHTLASLGNKITNLTVIIFDNELLESGGNVNSRSVYFDWSKYAESWGLKLSVLYEIEEIESLFAKRTNLSQATLIVLKVNNESSPITCQKDIDGIESKYGFKRFINTHINKGIIKPAVKN